MNKRLLADFTLILLIAVCIIGCSRKSSQSTADDEKESQKKLQEHLLKPKEEKIVLLALKYKLDRDKIEAVVRTYLTNHDTMFLILQVDRPSEVPKTESIPETIAYLEREYGIPSDVLASIIIDYQMWDFIDFARDFARDRDRSKEME